MSKRRRTPLTHKQIEALELSEKIVAEKQAEITNVRKSKQERFKTTKDKSNFFWNVYKWVEDAEMIEPDYQADSRLRDTWLRQFVKLEPFLNGVLTNVVTIDKNRGWTMVGGDRVVRKYVSLCHNLGAAADLRGWRPHLSQLSQSFNGTDIGAIDEIEYTGSRMSNLYTVDPCLCRLTGNIKEPLEFNQPNEAATFWKPKDYFRIVDMPSTDEKMYGLGICAISRCLEMARIMVALYTHDKEKLLAKAPKGLLLLNGIDEQQWENTLTARETQMTALEKRYYQGVQVFASTGPEEITAKLVSLSSIPEGLNHDTFTNIVMYLYALCFKYDPREFWPVSGGQLGTATETEVQHRKATGKGGMDFALAFQERFQEILPQTIAFEFEARDVDGEQQDINLEASIIKNITTLMTTMGEDGTPLISVEQARKLLAENEIIPKEWAEQSTTVTTDKEDDSDTGETDKENPTPMFEQSKTAEANYDNLFAKMKDNLMFRETIERNLTLNPNEPIFCYYEKEGRGTYERINASYKSPSYSIARPVQRAAPLQPVHVTVNVDPTPITVNVEPTPVTIVTPKVNVKVEPNEINVQVAPTPVTIENKIPETKTPDVYIEMDPAQVKIENIIPTAVAPDVNINVSPTPVQVKNDIKVSPTPVEIKNEIKLPAPEVTVEKQKPRKVKIIRDRDGKIDGLEEK